MQISVSNSQLEANFLESIQSEVTKKLYQRNVKNYIQTQGFANYEDLMKEEPAAIQARVIKFITDKKKSGLSSITLNGYINAIKLFYDMQDLAGINWKRVRRYKGEYVKTAHDTAYTVDQIKHLLTFCDLRKKIIILLPASSGVRIGALATLSIGDFSPVQEGKIYKMIVYRNSKQEYLTFCSSECKQVIDEYLEYRKRFGENITAKSPLIRDQFDQNDPEQAKHPKRLSDSQIKMIMFRMLIQSGMRAAKGDGSRKDVMASHGLRKFFNTVCIDSGVNIVVKEMLMGHRTIGLEGSYYRPAEDKLLQEYLKAVDNLTIHSQHRLEMKLKEAEDKVKSSEQMKAELRKEIEDEFEKRMDEFDRRVDEAVTARGG